ncbi:hypothetical protein [Dyella sp. 2RAB6]|uniref:hypothetical protein n=1 Tax=Dyella sp. 2RAB6 TaxID=3232992 RepID=UPI003F935438
MLTTASVRPAPLPWLATVVALIVGVVPFLFSLAVQRGWPALSEGARAIAYASTAGSLVFRAGVAFLVAQWHGERHGQLAFQRPAIVLSLFGVFLLCWQGVQIGAVALMVRLATAGTSMQIMLAASSLLYPLLHALGTWLAWIIAARIMRKEALPWPSFNARWRTAGLAAWVLASVLAMLTPVAMSTLTSLGLDSYALAAASYAAVALIPVALAFVGAWLGLPRYLAGIHGWRWLGATVGALASGAGAIYRASGMLAGLPLDTAMGPVLVGSGGLLLCLFVFWAWTFACYTGLHRTAAP